MDIIIDYLFKDNMDKMVKKLIEEYNISEEEARKIVENIDNMGELLFKMYIRRGKK